MLRAENRVGQQVGERETGRFCVPAGGQDRPEQRVGRRWQQRDVRVPGDGGPGARGQLVLQWAQRGQLHGPDGRKPYVAAT